MFGALHFNCYILLMHQFLLLLLILETVTSICCSPYSFIDWFLYMPWPRIESATCCIRVYSKQLCHMARAWINLSTLFKNRIYLFLEEGKEGRKRGRETSMCERNIDQLPLICPHPRNWPKTQGYALSRNPTSDLLLCRVMPNPLSHVNLGDLFIFM